MILSITPNPAVDRTVLVDSLRIGMVHGGASGFQAAGGKGLNVARAIRSLGGAVMVAGPTGGLTGATIQSLADSEGLRPAFTPIDDESRTCTILTDGAGSSTVINEAGPHVTSKEWARFVRDVGALASAAGFVTVSGSFPPGASPGSLRSLAGVCPVGGERVWIDCAPQWMAEALETGRSIKVNHHEAAGSLGLEAPATDRQAWATGAAQALVDRGAHSCVITLGSQGAVWADPEEVLVGEAPSIDAVNAVGSGDSFLAGLVIALERGESKRRSLALALATGAANAMEKHAGSFSESAAQELASTVVVR